MKLNIESAQKFIGHLGALVAQEDRGALAALRSGLGKPAHLAARMHRYVIPALPDGASPKITESCYVIASLFALWHQGKCAPEFGKGSFGHSLRLLSNALASPGSPNEERDSGIERRFVALTAASKESLPMHLRQMVARLGKNDIPINWARLLCDMHYWEEGDRRTQLLWAKDFWTDTN